MKAGAGSVWAFWARHPHWGTGLVIVFCLLLGLDSDMPRWGPADDGWRDLAVNTVVSLSLLWRRHHPWWVLVMTVAGEALTPETQVVAYAVAM